MSVSPKMNSSLKTLLESCLKVSHKEFEKKLTFPSIKSKNIVSKEVIKIWMQL